MEKNCSNKLLRYFKNIPDDFLKNLVGIPGEILTCIMEVLLEVSSVEFLFCLRSLEILWNLSRNIWRKLKWTCNGKLLKKTSKKKIRRMKLFLEGFLLGFLNKFLKELKQNTQWFLLKNLGGLFGNFVEIFGQIIGKSIFWKYLAQLLSIFRMNPRIFFKYDCRNFSVNCWNKFSNSVDSFWAFFSTHLVKISLKEFTEINKDKHS